MANLTFSVEAKAETSTKTVVKTRGFEIVIDEPVHLGGQDIAPNPLEFMLAAHAGCINVISHIVAQQMGITLSGLEISVEASLEPDILFGKSEHTRAGFGEIKAVVKVKSDADEETLQKWFEAVEKRCPVLENLKNETPMKTVLCLE